MGMYEKFAPVILRQDLTTAEFTFIENLAGISYQTGDLLYYNGTSLTRLGIGSTGQVLSVTGGLPSWQDTVAGNVTGPVTSTDNAITRWNGTTGDDLQNSTVLVDDTGNITPVTSDGASLGTTTLMWADLYLASGGTINFNSGDVIISHGANRLDIDGGVVDFGSTPTVNGASIYYAGGTDVALADGGTGASLADPNADSILFWDDSLGAVTFLTAGSGLTITGTTITASGTGVPWTEVTGTSVSAAVNNGYILNNAGLVTLTIPTTAAVGDVVRVVGKGAGGWLVAQNASEIIHFGNLDTTTGVGGSLASTHRRDVVELVCVVANTEWSVTSVIGNITVV